MLRHTWKQQQQQQQQQQRPQEQRHWAREGWAVLKYKAQHCSSHHTSGQHLVGLANQPTCCLALATTPSHGFPSPLPHQQGCGCFMMASPPPPMSPPPHTHNTTPLLPPPQSTMPPTTTTPPLVQPPPVRERVPAGVPSRRMGIVLTAAGRPSHQQPTHHSQAQHTRTTPGKDTKGAAVRAARAVLVWVGGREGRGAVRSTEWPRCMVHWKGSLHSNLMKRIWSLRTSNHSA
jgi:hypothetical protein